MASLLKRRERPKVSARAQAATIGPLALTDQKEEIEMSGTLERRCQQKSRWCWSACLEEIARFDGISTTQCEIAETKIGGCRCDEHYPCECRQEYPPCNCAIAPQELKDLGDEVLRRTDALKCYDGFLSKQELVHELSIRKRPVLVAVKYENTGLGALHLIVVTDFDGNYFCVHDPIHGENTRTYTGLAKGVDSVGPAELTWTTSGTCQIVPAAAMPPMDPLMLAEIRDTLATMRYEGSEGLHEFGRFGPFMLPVWRLDGTIEDLPEPGNKEAVLSFDVLIAADVGYRGLVFDDAPRPALRGTLSEDNVRRLVMAIFDENKDSLVAEVLIPLYGVRALLYRDANDRPRYQIWDGPRILMAAGSIDETTLRELLAESGMVAGLIEPSE